MPDSTIYAQVRFVRLPDTTPLLRERDFGRTPYHSLERIRTFDWRTRTSCDWPLHHETANGYERSRTSDLSYVKALF